MFRKKFFLLAYLAIVPALIGFVNANTNGKTILTDAEMSNVNGGGNCLYCAPWGNGCAYPSGDCSVPACTLEEKSTCRQWEWWCSGPGQLEDNCVNISTNCTGTYTTKFCYPVYYKLVVVGCVIYSEGTYDCTGSKHYCWDI